MWISDEGARLAEELFWKHFGVQDRGSPHIPTDDWSARKDNRSTSLGLPSFSEQARCRLRCAVTAFGLAPGRLTGAYPAAGRGQRLRRLLAAPSGSRLARSNLGGLVRTGLGGGVLGRRRGRRRGTRRVHLDAKHLGQIILGDGLLVGAGCRKAHITARMKPVTPLESSANSSFCLHLTSPQLAGSSVAAERPDRSQQVLLKGLPTSPSTGNPLGQTLEGPFLTGIPALRASRWSAGFRSRSATD